MRDDRLVMLDLAEIRFAEADRNTVWLKADHGLLRAATRGLDRLAQQIEGKGFLPRDRARRPQARTATPPGARPVGNLLGAPSKGDGGGSGPRATATSRPRFRR